MNHSVYFSEDLNCIGPLSTDDNVVNSYEDLHLVSQVRPFIAPPSLKTKYLDIPGGNGGIDLTTSLTGRPTYDYRSGSMEFLILNDFDDWDDAYHRVLRWFHGKEFKIGLEDEACGANGGIIPWYKGRLAIDGYAPGSSKSSSWSKFQIKYKLEPYRERFVELQHFATEGSSILENQLMDAPDISDLSSLITARFNSIPTLAVRCKDSHKIVVNDYTNRVKLFEGIVLGDSADDNPVNLPKTFLDLDWSSNYKEGYPMPEQYEITLTNLEDNDVDAYIYSLVKEI